MLDIHIVDKTFTSNDGSSRQIINDFRIKLEPNSFTTLFGPSGCGKSTTLRIALGLDEDFTGNITPNPHSVRFASVFQEPTLLPWRTAEENIRLCLEDKLEDEYLDSILEQLEIKHARKLYPRELSLGMARRFALARAFAPKPDVLVLDEPFVSLDEAMATRLRAYLKSLCETFQPTVLMVSHNLTETKELSDNIIYLDTNPMRISDEVLI